MCVCVVFTEIINVTDFIQSVCRRGTLAAVKTRIPEAHFKFKILLFVQRRC